MIYSTNDYTYEPRCEKTGLRDFRPDATQSGLYVQLQKMTRSLEFWIEKVEGL